MMPGARQLAGAWHGTQILEPSRLRCPDGSFSLESVSPRNVAKAAYFFLRLTAFLAAFFFATFFFTAFFTAFFGAAFFATFFFLATVRPPLNRIHGELRLAASVCPKPTSQVPPTTRKPLSVCSEFCLRHDLFDCHANKKPVWLTILT
jgi:hypothetical protein